MIIVDCSGAFIRYTHTVLKNPADLTLHNVRHYMLNELRTVNKKYRKKYGRIVLTWDNTHHGNWRKDVFPEYKANRIRSHEKSVFDWSKFFGFYGIVKQEIQDHFPYKSYDIPLLEADDIIGWLCESKDTEEEILIYSADKDFKQLQRYGKIKQWSYMTNKFLVEKNPLMYLKEHTIRGDSSDGVPNVYSDNDVFISPLKKQKAIMTKDLDRWLTLHPKLVKQELAEKMLKKTSKSMLTEKLCIDTLATVEKNWRRNANMVDLALLPQKYKDLIEEVSHEPIKAKANKLYSYFIKKRMTIMIEYLDDFL